MFEVRDVDLAGRIGKLYTRHGVVETPAFFPVIDPARQEVELEAVREAGIGQVITNAYLLYKRTGGAPVSIHEYLGWKGPVMTDSGAYQILEYGGVDVTQDEIVEYQARIGSDIAVILDVPTGDVDRRRAEASVEETLRRAREASRLITKSPETIWVLPIQGGRFLDLVERSAREAGRLPGYSMYGIGSPTVFLDRYQYDVVVDIVYTAKRLLPAGRPVHLFGAGHPLIIPFVVALGVDTFDSASYILYARDGRYITEYGVYRIEDLDYFPCDCPVCRRYTPKDLLEMSKEERTRLLAIHNLHVISRMVRRVKQAIKEGRLWELLEEVARRHPAAQAAFRRFRKYHRYLELHTPVSKGRVRGLRAYGFESLWNPKLTRLQARALARVGPPRGPRRAVLVRLSKAGSCPQDSDDTHYAIYDYYVGVFPSALCGVYPTIHVDYGGVDPLVAKHLDDAVTAYVHRLRERGYKEVEVRGAPWHLARRLARLRRSLYGVEISVDGEGVGGETGDYM